MSAFAHLTAKDLNGLLQTIADRRVQGQDWEAIAAELKQPVLEIRTVVFEKEEQYRPLLLKARREQKRLCFDTALEKLRQQTNSSNEKISHSAASMLARIDMMEERNRARKEKAKRREQKKVETAQKPLDPKQVQAIAKMTASALPQNPYSILHTNPTIEDMVKRCLADERLNVDLKGKKSS